MSLTSISTLVMSTLNLAAIQRTQVKLSQVTAEIASGKVYDVGLALGGKVSDLLDLQQHDSELTSLQQTNGVLQSRLSTMDTALSSMTSLANSFSQAALSATTSDTARQSLIDAAKSGLSQLSALLSTTYDGAHVFGGINSGVAPVADYMAQPQGAGRTAVQTGFAAAFGFQPSDPQAASITPAQMQDYLNGQFAANFQDASWQASFSSDSTTPASNRIAPGEDIATPVTANSPGIRQLYSALAAVVDSGADKLSASTFQSLAKSVASMASTAAGQLGDAQSEIGLVQGRVTNANDSMAAQQTILQNGIGKLVDIDPAEASTRLNQLTATLQASYEVTARLQQLSILNYLPPGT